MRLSVASLRRMINGKLPVEFVDQDVTSYSATQYSCQPIKRRVSGR